MTDVLEKITNRLIDSGEPLRLPRVAERQPTEYEMRRWLTMALAHLALAEKRAKTAPDMPSILEACESCAYWREAVADWEARLAAL